MFNSANILITKDGLVKLADFGIAAVPEGSDNPEATLRTLREGGNPYKSEANKEAVGSPYWSKYKLFLCGKGKCKLTHMYLFV